MINTPVLVIGFKRKESLKKIIDTLRESDVKNIYFSFDTWRNEEEKKLCLEVRDLVKTINWEVNKIEVFYEDTNKGLFDHVVNSINWFFENEEMGIILEDDIIPGNEFYKFCEEMLIKYKDFTSIKTISGFCYIENNDSFSYYLSLFQSSWGWATWKDRWLSFDLTLKNIEEKDILQTLRCFLIPENIISYYIYLFRRTKEDYKSLGGWDYNVLFNMFKQYGLSIQVNTSLVKNIGNDEFAEHFSENSTIEGFNKGKIYPLKEPKRLNLAWNREYDIKRLLKEYTFLK